MHVAAVLVGEGVSARDESYPRVEFVDGAVGFEPRVVFGDACPSDERCRAAVAAAGVYVAFFVLFHSGSECFKCCEGVVECGRKLLRVADDFYN